MCFISVAATVVLIARNFNKETLLCRVEGNPTPHVSWIGPDGEVKKNSTIIASSLGNLGQGKYTCKAINALGSDQKSYTVTRKDFFWPVVFCCFYLFNYLLLCCCCCYCYCYYCLLYRCLVLSCLALFFLVLSCPVLSFFPLFYIHS